MLERQLADTRILVVGLPRLLSGVMSGIMAGQLGLEIIGEASVKGMLQAVAALRPDVVILSGEAGATEGPIALLHKGHPQLRIVSIDAEGRSATAHEPGSAARQVNDISPEILLEMLRGSPG
jgi:chemotaxis response regulator CheB